MLANVPLEPTSSRAATTPTSRYARVQRQSSICGGGPPLLACRTRGCPERGPDVRRHQRQLGRRAALRPPATRYGSSPLGCKVSGRVQSRGTAHERPARLVANCCREIRSRGRSMTDGTGAGRHGPGAGWRRSMCLRGQHAMGVSCRRNSRLEHPWCSAGGIDGSVRAKAGVAPGIRRGRAVMLPKGGGVPPQARRSKSCTALTQPVPAVGEIEPRPLNPGAGGKGCADAANDVEGDTQIDAGRGGRRSQCGYARAGLQSRWESTPSRADRWRGSAPVALTAPIRAGLSMKEADGRGDG